MKVLLVQPQKAPVTLGGEDVFLFEPLALEYLAAGLSPHHDMKILDMRLDRNLRRALEDFSPDVVEITETAHAASLGGLKDIEALGIATSEGRILVTHDFRIMPTHFAQFVRSQRSPV